MKKVTIRVNGKDVEITLTPEQIAQIQTPKEITTLKEAILYLGESDKDVIELNKLIKAECNTDFQELVVIIKAINGKQVLDWDDSNTKKYFIWFDMRKKGSCGGWAYHYTDSDVPARLYFISLEKLQHFIKYFEENYRKYMKK